ncbi:Xaa-Pro peptidase family protein [Burkholderia cepacia]|uniref:Xaa-Pro peptidase family protein n=1 Tax=Burkholderia cepacia TaxID=292 RepID=UPI002AB7C1A7|nr:Xaa-Pro peptidase family protein [Burkholderia cepacia]
MQQAQVDLKRARDLLGKNGLDAVIAYGGANFYYLTGFQNYFDNPAGSMALLPADESIEPWMLVGDWMLQAATPFRFGELVTFPMWMEIVDLEQLRTQVPVRSGRPVRFDVEANIRRLADAIKARGLVRGRIGIELSVVSVSVFEMLRKHLPDVTWDNSLPVLFEMRAYKTTQEIDYLRQATRLTEDAMLAVVAEPIEGCSINDLKLRYEAACNVLARQASLAGFQGTRVTASIGADVSPVLAGGPVATADDLVFFDVGSSIFGYGSDTGRTLTSTKPAQEARDMLDAVRAGLEAAFELVRPGSRMCDVFHAGQDAVRKRGMQWFTRGHVGHTMGLGMGEMPPFLAPKEMRPLEPGMVMALEIPLYVRGLGGFQIEECFVVTGTGYDLLTSLPRDFLTAPQ